MIKQLFKTDNSLVGTILRITLVVMMLPMGYLKMIDFNNMLEILQSNYNLPMIIAFLVIIIEFFVPLFLIFGLGSRIGGLLLAIIMFGAMSLPALSNEACQGIQLRLQQYEIQFHLLAIGSALALFVSGGGKWSVDKLVMKKFE